MDGAQFLDLIERRRMVPRNLIENMRAQVAAAPRAVAAATVARVFVEAGHITAFQARQLIGGDAVEAKPSAELREDLHLPEPDELDFEPLEEYGHKEEPEAVEVPGGIEAPPVQLSERFGRLHDPVEGLLAGQSPAAHSMSSRPVGLKNYGRFAGLPVTAWVVMAVVSMALLMVIVVQLARR